MLKTAKIIKIALMSAALTSFSTAAVSGPNDYETLPIKAGTLYYKSQALPNGNVLVKDIWVYTTANGAPQFRQIGAPKPKLWVILCSAPTPGNGGGNPTEVCEAMVRESQATPSVICKQLGYSASQSWSSIPPNLNDPPYLFLNNDGDWDVPLLSSDSGYRLSTVECTNSPQPPGN